MKIRLKVTPPGGESTLFEHAGPVVRIGRDPGCELVLEGDAGTAASRQHACIELSPTDARLIDTGSANHTLHNHEVIKEPVALKRGDHIQIGHTGASLVVVDLDLAPAKPAGDRRWLLAAGGGVAAAVVLGAVVYFWPRRPPDGVVAVDPGRVETKRPKEKEPEAEKPRPPEPPPLTVKKVGYYLRPSDDRPSVLVQRAGENHPWAVLRSGQAVYTGHTLVGLPGYASQVYLDCGLRLNLWGHLPDFEPEFDPKADPKADREARRPVRESAVVLNPPPDGVDADLTLDRGRVEVECVAARCVVRLRFLREVWDVTLAGRGSKVCAELWARPAVGADTGPALCLGLFSQGKVAVQAGRHKLEFSGHARAAWANWQPKELFQEKLDKAPGWWVKSPRETDRAKDAFLSLQDWATKRLDVSDDVVYTLLAAARDLSNDPTDRRLGVLFLAALEETSHLFEFLEDPARNTGEVRNAAMLGLQDWLLRNGPQQSVLVRQAQRRRSYSSNMANLVVGLLAPLPPKAYADAETYQKLIGHLDDDNTAVRHLADWHLCGALPEWMQEDAEKIGYDPMLEKDKRAQAVAQWRKLLPAGKLPPRSDPRGSGARPSKGGGE